MKAVATQNGTIIIADIPATEPPAGHVLIRTEFSAISPGTETTFIRKASDKQVVLGYSAVGIVEKLGEGVEHLSPGQRVACYGAPYVRHAEYLTVPSNLTALVPDGVRPEDAAFAGLGAIAIHALRVADLRFGESAIVVGLGILGQLIAQIASAAAYRTAGLDIDATRAERLRQHGVPYAFHDQEQMEARLGEITGGHGADSVLLCAGGPGEALINRSFTWIRDRGKIVIVGDLTAEYSRGAMFGKEAQVLISRAGGPGRYDASYERDNCDYPIGYVRWTEGRNIGEYVRLLAEKRIRVESLITNTYPVDQAEQAYAKLGDPSTVGTLLKY